MIDVAFNFIMWVCVIGFFLLACLSCLILVKLLLCVMGGSENPGTRGQGWGEYGESTAELDMQDMEEEED